MKLRVIAAVAFVAATGARAEPASTALGTVRVLGADYAVSLLYDSDADFILQSFDELAPTITFTTPADAFAAAEALRDTFGASFDWHPAAAPDFNGTRFAFAYDDTNYEYVTLSDCCGLPEIHGPFARARSDANYYSFAQFTLAVPEPASGAMALLGLVALGLARRRGA